MSKKKKRLPYAYFIVSNGLNPPRISRNEYDYSSCRKEAIEASKAPGSQVIVRPTRKECLEVYIEDNEELLEKLEKEVKRVKKWIKEAEVLLGGKK